MVEPVSIVMPMRNSETTVALALDSVKKQKYPIGEILVIDNNSTDYSVRVVDKYKKSSNISIKIFLRKKNKGVGSSFNEGVKRAKSRLVVLMHSDGMLPTDHELEKLTKPFRDNKEVAVTFPSVVLPERVWNTYNFWQKLLFTRAVNMEIPSLNGKFDCIRKEIFEKIGGFDTEKFQGDKGVGGEDADFHFRLKKAGPVVFSGARVYHLHYLGSSYSFFDLLKTKKLNARSYGRLLRIQGRNLKLNSLMIFGVRPVISVLPFIPYLHWFGIWIILIYMFVYSKTMFVKKSAFQDYRIFFLPFVNLLLLYYETFWMIESFLYIKKRV